jgi:hypothetical protein
MAQWKLNSFCGAPSSKQIKTTEVQDVSEAKEEQSSQDCGEFRHKKCESSEAQS